MKVWRRESKFQGGRRPLAIIYPEQVDTSDLSAFRNFDNEVWLVWKSMEYESATLANRPTTEFDKYWGPDSAYQWIVEELIPYALFVQSLGEHKSVFGTAHSFRKFMRKFDVSNYVTLRRRETAETLEGVKTIVDCARVAGNLQGFFHRKKQVYLSAKSLKSIYNLMVAYLKRWPACTTSYVMSNLGHNPVKGELNLVETLEQECEHLTDGGHNAFQTDCLFRAIDEMLDVIATQPKAHSDEFDVTEFVDAIREIWNYKETEEKFDRLSLC